MKKLIVLLILAFAILLPSSIYIVKEDELAVVRQFGQIKKVHVSEKAYIEKSKEDLKKEGVITAVVANKGLNFKIPFISSVEKYTSKLITYTSNTETINTKDKRKIDIRMYAQYDIVNPGLVSIKMDGKRYESKLNALLDDKVYPVVIKTGNSLAFDEFFNIEIIEPALDEKRESLNEQLVSQFGVYIQDASMYRKNPPEENMKAIESKMREEILKESEEIHAEGNRFYNEKVALVDKNKKITVNTARQEAADIKANADQEALDMIEKALRVDVEFYKFVKRMELMSNIKDTQIFIDKNNNIFEYLD